MIKTQLMNRKEVAKMFQVSEGTVRNWTLKAGLPTLREEPGKRVYFSAAALTDWAKKREKSNGSGSNS